MILSKRMLKDMFMFKNTVSLIKTVFAEMRDAMLTMLKLVFIVAAIVSIITFGLSMLMVGVGVMFAVVIAVYALNMKLNATMNGEKIGTWCRKDGFVRL